MGRYFIVGCFWLLWGLSFLTQPSFSQVSPANQESFLSGDWNWVTLLSRAEQQETTARIYELQELLSLEEARFLLSQLQNFSSPADLRRLSELEKEQAQRGGGFFGIIPNYFTRADTLPLPDNFDHLIATALRLAQIREKNLHIASNPAFQFPLDFQGESLPSLTGETARKNIRLVFDFSVIEKLLALFSQPGATLAQAREIANHKIFREMLEHRRNLGYVPEPLPDSEDLAYFIYLAASRQPVEQIWKWLNPWNNFGLADLYRNRADYRRLIQYWKQNRAQLEGLVTDRLARCVPQNVQFRDTVSFAVNFGIRSWATRSSLGTNLIQFKDHYPLMLRTIAHESFHRLQLKICPVAASRKNKKKLEFEDLVVSDFPREADRKFYRALTYIMLEGTATYVGGVDSSWISTPQLAAGKALLKELVATLYQKKNFESYEELINRGLRSNGPFYALGYTMSRLIAERDGSEQIGLLLQQGSGSFFLRYLSILHQEPLAAEYRFPPELEKQIRRLAEEK